MKKRPDVIEWVGKAEQDYQTAETMAKKSRFPVPDVVGFHCQQCVEKYLKAILVLYKLDFPKTHDLMELLEIALKKEPMLDIFRSDLRFLNPFSVPVRYPGESITVEESKVALKIMRRLRKYLKDRLSV